MPIFRLDPVGLDHRDWHNSTYHAAAFVRATSERCARIACMMAFGIGSRIEADETAPTVPWTQSERVTCVQVSDERWSEDGPIELLLPTIQREILRQQIARINIDR